MAAINKYGINDLFLRALLSKIVVRSLRPMVSHPSNLLPLYTALAAAELGSNFHFEFSRYVYIPQQISEKRDWFTIPAENAEEAWKQSTSSLKAHEEIALHSRVTGHQGMRHLPFLDMGCAHIENHLDDLKLAFKDFNIPKMTIFSSGRSYHIYGHGLLRDDATLVRFMGQFMLLQIPVSLEVSCPSTFHRKSE